MAKELRVGVIGVSSARGWASVSHVPAIQGVPGLQLAGVTGKTQEAADEVARTFGAARGFAGVDRLIDDPDIDLVTVAVRVPSHRELVLKALAAGKHVYCEWPLGRNTQEAEELRDAAEQAGVHVAIGLQSRRNPALLRAQELLHRGAIGRVLSARMVSGTVAFGPAEDEADTYLEDPANGATHLTIHGGHAVDSAIALLGPLRRVAAMNTVQFRHISIDKGKRILERTIADHLLITAETETSAALAIEVEGGRSREDSRFRFEVTGEEGTLALQGGAAVGFQAGRLELTVNGKPESINEGDLAGLSDPATNIAAMYATLRDDIANGTRTTPDLAHAVRLTALLTAIDQASASGQQAQSPAWPLA